jgi:hypothetical protein
MNDFRDLDVLVACPVCGAAVNVDCFDYTRILPVGNVHTARRVRRLLKERGATDEDLQKAIDTGVPLKGN